MEELIPKKHKPSNQFVICWRAVRQAERFRIPWLLKNFGEKSYWLFPISSMLMASNCFGSAKFTLRRYKACMQLEPFDSCLIVLMKQKNWGFDGWNVFSWLSKIDWLFSEPINTDIDLRGSTAVKIPNFCWIRMFSWSWS